MGSVAADWFHCIPLDLSPFPVGPSGSFRAHAPLVNFASSLERPVGPGAPPPRLPAALALSSREIRCVISPHSTSSTASTPNDVAIAFGQLESTSQRVPPTWFLTTSTVYSAKEFPGLLHPGTERGSPRFQPQPPLASRPPKRTRASGRPQLFPLRPSHPSKKSSLGSHDASLRRFAFSSLRLRFRDDPRPQGLAPPLGP
jgi:hypothetical protein